MKKNHSEAIDYAASTAISALSQAESNTKKIDAHDKSISVIHQKLAQLSRENIVLNDKMLQIDNMGRRDNIIIRGVEEKEGESCHNTVSDIIKKAGCNPDRIHISLWAR